MSPPRVLVVEDEMIVARDLSDRLQSLGFEVPTIAGTAAEAIAAAAEVEPDLILMDIRLRGDGDGITAALELRNSTDIPVVYLTAYADEETRSRAEASNPFGYLLKPFNEMELLCTIQMALAKHRQQQEERLRSEHLSALLGGIADGVVAIDDQARVTYLNSSAASLTEWPAESAIGQPLSRLLAPVDEAGQADLTGQLTSADAALSARQLSQPIAIQTKSGRRRWITASVHGIREENGANAVVTFRDVTDALKATASLKAAESRWRSLVQHLPGIVVMLDRDGRIVSSAAGLQAMNFTLEEGAYLTHLFDESGREQLSNLIENSGANPNDSGPVSAELSVTAPDGSRAFYSASASAIEGDEQQKAATVVLLRDVTAERRLRLQLTQSQKMEALGQLAGGIAHDFNNLLTVLLSYLFFIKDGVRGESTLASDANEAIETANRAKALTQQLLSFSRSQLVHPVKLDLCEAISGLTTMLRRIIREDLEIEFVANSDRATIEVDRGQLEQLIMNLVLNARDAIHESGKIQIRVDRVELNGVDAAGLGRLSAGPHYRLSVLDNGVGMDETTRDRMFEPFFTTKEQGRGTGLGLAVVYGLVMKSRGAISVDSVIGKGTRVDVYFPAVRGTGETTPPPITGQTAKVGGRVLLVEDDPILLRLSTRALEKCGFEVLDALNGEEALAVLRKSAGAVDLVVSDVVMPKMGGIALARELHGALPAVPVLLTSGYAEQTDEKTSSNVVGFLAKPYSPDELAARIREILSASADAS